MVYRVFVEKKLGLDNESQLLKNEIRDFLHIKALDDLRIIKRYDVENIDSKTFEACKKLVFSQPQLDNVYDKLDLGECQIFAVEFQPG